ncbi:MAG: phage holin family protein [Thermomicrobiales bacterium]
MTGRIIAYIVGSIVAVLALGTIFQDRFVTYTSESAVLIFGIILGALSAFLKPALQLMTLPITCLTFGAFALVVNAALFGLAAWLTPGLQVTLWGAVIGAVLASVTNGIVFSIVDERT